MRTDAEKQAFAMKCLEIEKEGGDVLGYIEVNWPSYSPRATWYNLQRQYLNRNTNQLTEGKRKEGNELRRDRKEMLDGVLKVLSEKGDPLVWLKKQGYGNPHQAWTDLRAWANKHGLNQGRLPANLNTYYAMLKRQEEEPPEETVETVTFGGKEYEKLEGTKLYPPFPNAADKDIYGKHPVTAYVEKKPSPTCCQPAKQGSPIKWDDNEAMTDGPEEISMRKLSIKEEPIKELKLRTLQGEMGTYEKLADDRMLFTGSPRPFTDCGYTVAEWFVLIEELQIAIKQLGLK